MSQVWPVCGTAVMGTGNSKLPPVDEQELRIVLSYRMSQRHIVKIWNKFVEVDEDCNGVWTAGELYKLIEESRESMRAPIIDALFFMGDGKNEGSIGFRDFLVTFTSFCALSKEEMVQFLFIIMDADRNGYVEKCELVRFFSYVPAGTSCDVPIFPINNKNALEKFKDGNWNSLEFDGLAQLCQRFPYIPYPAYHTQELFRRHLLGKAFWDSLDQERNKQHGASKSFRVVLPGTKKKVEVKLPERVTMQELLEFSRRKTQVQAGKRVASQDNSESDSALTKERDEQIRRCPLLNMIRNPRCMYHVPIQGGHHHVAKQPKSSGLDLVLEEDTIASTTTPGSRSVLVDQPIPGVRPATKKPKELTVLDLAGATDDAEDFDDSDSGSDYTDEDEDES